jgi:imidazolonepropionase-like amidohydrolase
MEPVVDLLVKGHKPGEIARATGLTIPEVNRVINEWRALASDDRAVRERAKQVVAGADAHFGDLIRESYRVLEEANDEMGASGTTAALLAQKTSAIKTIADLEVKRFSMLRDLGVLTNHEEAEHYAKMEDDHKVLEDILREVVFKCEHCKYEVARRMARVSGKPEVIVEHA